MRIIQGSHYPDFTVPMYTIPLHTYGNSQIVEGHLLKGCKYVYVLPNSFTFVKNTHIGIMLHALTGWSHAEGSQWSDCYIKR